MIFGLFLIAALAVFIGRRRGGRLVALGAALVFVVPALWLADSFGGHQVAALLAAGLATLQLSRHRAELTWAINRMRDCPWTAVSAPLGFLAGVFGGSVAIYAAWLSLTSPSAAVMLMLGLGLLFLGQWSMMAPSRFGSWRFITSLPYRVLREGQGAVTEDLGEARHVAAVMLGASLVASVVYYGALSHRAPGWILVLCLGLLLDRFVVAASAVEAHRQSRRVGRLVAVQRRELAEHFSQYPPQRREKFAWYSQEA